MALPTCHLCGCPYRAWAGHRYGPARTCATNRLSQRAWARDWQLRAGGYAPAGAYGGTVRRGVGEDVIAWSPSGVANGRITSWALWAPAWAVKVAEVRIVPAQERRAILARARGDLAYRARVFEALAAARTEAQIEFGERDEEMLGRADVVQILRGA